MDVVYILGDGSLSNDEEIKYSIRSLERNMLDLGQVFVVGKKPVDLPGVIHIEAEDDSNDRWKNAHKKTLLACNDERVSDDFLFMNDDFFMTLPFNGADLPFYSARTGHGGVSGRLSFSIHSAIRFNKEYYLNMPVPENAPREFSPRTFYANFYQAPPFPVNDCIVRHGEGLPSFDIQIGKEGFFSLSDGTMTDPIFAVWLDSLFPEPSRFE